MWSDQPKFDVQLEDPEKLQNNLLLPRKFGFIILTTSAGIMDQEEARQKTPRTEIPGILFLGCNTYVQIKCLNRGKQKASAYCFLREASLTALLKLNLIFPLFPSHS